MDLSYNKGNSYHNNYDKDDDTDNNYDEDNNHDDRKDGYMAIYPYLHRLLLLAPHVALAFVGYMLMDCAFHPSLDDTLGDDTLGDDT